MVLSLAGCSLIPFSEVLFAKGQTESTQPAGVIFYDDFSDATSGWDRVESELGGTDYVEGGYHILVDEINTDYFSTLYRNYENISLQVEATWIGGPKDNNYGLICRYKDEKNFYAAMVSSDGYYAIFTIENGIYRVLGHDNMMLSELIREDSNTIRMDCYQDFIFLYVNDNLLDVQQDDTFSGGDVGLIAGSFDAAGVHIAFDNFYLLDPEQLME